MYPYTGRYQVAIICENGHLIASDTNDSNANNFYCADCGALTVSSCRYCGAPIRGRYKEQNATEYFAEYVYVPSYCHFCGDAYPWTERIHKRTNKLIELDEKLTNCEKR